MRILFITSNRLGDAVLSTGLLQAYMTYFPEAKFTVACGPVATSLFETCPQVTEIIALKKQKYAGHWRALWRQAIGTKWDYVIDLRRSVIAPLLRARHRIVAPKAPDHLHRVAHLSSLGPIKGDITPPHIWLSDEDVVWARQQLTPQGPDLSPDVPLIAFGPAANWRGKQWRARRFAALADQLTAAQGLFPGAKIVILAAPTEKAQSEEMKAHLQQADYIDLTGIGTPRQSAACLSLCQAYIGNDSGLMHLSAALGKMTFGLFGPSRPEHYRPWGAKNCVIHTPESYEELVYRPDYDHKTTDSLMDGLTVEMVYHAIQDHLAQEGS